MKLLVSETKISDGKAKFLGPMLTGLVSRSPNTAKVHRLFRDGKNTESDFKAAIALDSEKIILGQKKFAFISGGQLDWLDIIRPSLNISGVSAEPITRHSSTGPMIMPAT